MEGRGARCGRRRAGLRLQPLPDQVGKPGRAGVGLGIGKRPCGVPEGGQAVADHRARALLALPRLARRRGARGGVALEEHEQDVQPTGRRRRGGERRQLAGRLDRPGGGGPRRGGARAVTRSGCRPLLVQLPERVEPAGEAPQLELAVEGLDRRPPRRTAVPEGELRRAEQRNQRLPREAVPDAGEDEVDRRRERLGRQRQPVVGRDRHAAVGAD